ncbi:hypothetical protein TCAL_16336 [Tigriopus californicus]|uniref:C2H2-type domain-containing protein n=1 Tax=Tigriopus californicus TaxID=6832 RepID=A0A553N777_TIGCA|nr:hypothetical protein TCAL_16336 [Tigriopus californicus]
MICQSTEGKNEHVEVDSYVQPYLVTTECSGIHMCRLCGYKGSRGHVSKHVRRKHLKIKPFSCTLLCGYKGSRAHVVRHVRRKHLNIKPFACTLCDAMMATTEDQQDHYKRRHKMPLSRKELVALHPPNI